MHLNVLLIWYNVSYPEANTFRKMSGPRIGVQQRMWVHWRKRLEPRGLDASRSYSTQRAPGKKAAAPVFKVLVRPGREANSRPGRPAFTTWARAAVQQFMFHTC